MTKEGVAFKLQVKATLPLVKQEVFLYFVKSKSMMPLSAQRMISCMSCRRFCSHLLVPDFARLTPLVQFEEGIRRKPF